MHNIAPGRQQIVKERALQSMDDKADGQARPKTGKLAGNQGKKAGTSPIISTWSSSGLPLRKTWRNITLQ